MSKRFQLVAATLAAVAIILAVELAWRRLWGSWDMPGTNFGVDLVAYLNGARRLIETGSPYHPALHAGPIENRIENVPIGYLYPPPLAQLFTSLVDVPREALAIANALCQASIFMVLLPLLYLRGGGTLTAANIGAIWCTAILFFPLSMALYGGNVSGWIAIGVGLMLLRPRDAGFFAVAAGLLKMTPVLLALPTLISGIGRTRMIALGLSAIAVSMLTAPAAWLDWVRVLPNILRFPMSEDPINLSTGAVFAMVGVPVIGTLAGVSLGIGAVVATVALARRGRHEAAVAAAVMALLFIPSSLFDHYLVPTFVVACAAWPRATIGTRIVLIGFVVVGVIMWMPSLVPALRPALLAVIITASGVLIRDMMGGRLPHSLIGSGATSSRPDGVEG